MTFSPYIDARRVACAALLLFSGIGPFVQDVGAADPPPPAGQESKASNPAKAPLLETHIQPIFKAKCIRCHGEKTQKSELALTTRASIFKGGESGPAVEPGKPEESLLYEMVHDGLMPPEEENTPLTKAEIETIRRWIAGGAQSSTKSAGASKDASTAPLDQHDIIPIMLLRCTVCHGRRRQEAGLDLRTKAAMLQGGKSGPAIVPGKPEESLLVKKVRAGQMPPRKMLLKASVKPMRDGELDRLVRWIAQGASEASIQPDVAGGKPDTLVTDKDRQFWAFQPPRRVMVPKLQDAAGQLRNPIDAFVLEKLRHKGLDFSPRADKATLMRRAYFDLTGLPPEPEEVEAFLSNDDPVAYEKLIDRLLASPRYGERWARHWLDTAGYADSEGIGEEDRPRKFAYRFRDYIIRALNADKPYDRFLLEQIAGDELADYENGKEITPEIFDNLVATGFLRLAPDRTYTPISNFVPDRLEIIANEIDILSSTVLGLTLKCARCHSHKFDPIPQRDYYRLSATLKGALDEHDWIPPMLEKKDVPKNLHNTANRLLTAGPTAEKIRALWDQGEPSPTYILRRGDPTKQGRLVGPGVPAVLTDGKTPFVVEPPWPGAKQTGRRLALARWLVDPEHPLTARVMVNRIWKFHFGQGIVRSLGNFGHTGSSPSHPELLDWLAREFVRQGWSIKAMHRLMMTSNTYHQVSSPNELGQRLDGENHLLWRMPLTRLDAEQLRDTILFLSNCLRETPYGPPDKVEVRKDGLATATEVGGSWRRSIYVAQRRTQILSILETFDFPQMGPNCIQRSESAVSSQALHLLNSARIRHLARALASRVAGQAGSNPRRRIEYVFLIVLSRYPNEEETKVGLSALARLTAAYQLSAEDSKTVDPKAEDDKRVQPDPGQQALVALCHAMLNSAAFLYID